MICGCINSYHSMKQQFLFVRLIVLEEKYIEIRNFLFILPKFSCLVMVFVFSPYMLSAWRDIRYLKNRFRNSSGYVFFISSSRFLLRPDDVTTTSNLLFVHSFMQFQLKCVRDVIFALKGASFFVHSRD